MHRIPVQHQAAKNNPSNQLDHPCNMELSEIFRGLPDEILDQPCDDRVRKDVVKRIGSGWLRLAPELIEDEDIEAIQAEHRDLYVQCRELLKRWKQVHGDRATYRALLAGLNAIGRNDIACDVARSLKSLLPPRHRLHLHRLHLPA